MKEIDNGFLNIFGKLEDPRRERRKLHPMPEILLLTLCSVICGAESWIDIKDFGYAKMVFQAMIHSGDFSEPLIQRVSSSCLWRGFAHG